MNEILTAVTYSFESSTWITWLVLALLGAKTVQAFNTAYKDNETFKDMRNNENKMGMVQFYTGIILSFLCVLVFFLPYLLQYEG